MQQIKAEIIKQISACNDVRTLRIILQFVKGILGHRRPPTRSAYK